MKIIDYPDGCSYVVNDLNEESMLYRIESYKDLFLLKSIKDANPNLKEITIPWFFHQQHDRRFHQNESFDLKIVCDFINSCNFERVNVFHPHSMVIPTLLNNCFIINNKEFIQKVIIDIYGTQEIAERQCILMSSDAGGFKPLMELCDQIGWKGETFSATKARSYDSYTKESKFHQQIDRSDFQKKDILIIDDICVFGGTFIGLKNLLVNKNVNKLYLAVSHITVEQPNKELASYDKIYCTNSNLAVYHNFLNNLNIIKLFD